jgi:hypothetical protein
MIPWKHAADSGVSHTRPLNTQREAFSFLADYGTRFSRQEERGSIAKRKVA